MEFGPPALCRPSPSRESRPALTASQRRRLVKRFVTAHTRVAPLLGGENVETPHVSESATKARSERDADGRAESSAVPTREDPVWDRLEDQIEWFDKKAVQNQRSFKLLKYAEILTAAAIPVLTGFDVTREVLAVLGGPVLVIGSVHHLNQYQQNRNAHQQAAAALK